MSKCKDERLGIGADPGKPSLKIPLSSIKSVLQILKCAFQMPEISLPPITSREIELGIKFRQGISKTDTAARVINRKTSANIDIGPNNDGSDNKSNAKDKIMVEEIMDELMYKAKIEVVIPTGNLVLTLPGDGFLSSDPYTGTVTGSISNLKSGPIKAEGIIR
jgi:hypothetical protein